MLQQLLEGRIAFPDADRKAKMADTLRAMAANVGGQRPDIAGRSARRADDARAHDRPLPGAEPDDRFASGAELAEQLDGCRQLREAERQLPRVPAMFAPILRRPFLWLILAVVLPQLAGSVVNIVYNATQIVGAPF